MFRKNFKIFKYSLKIKENIFFSPKILKNALKTSKKKKWINITKVNSIIGKTMHISSYLKKKLHDQKRKKANFIYKKKLTNQKTLLYVLTKAKLFPSHLCVINNINQKKILVNNKVIRSSFTKIKAGDVIKFNSSYQKKIINNTEFFSKINAYKVITEIPGNFEVSFFAKTIVICYLKMLKNKDFSYQKNYTYIYIQINQFFFIDRLI